MIKKFLKVLKELAIATPMVWLCGMMMFPVENDHYGFEHPGINVDAVDAMILIGAIALIYASVVLLVRHKKRVNFIMPFITYAIVFVRLNQIISVALSYYEFYKTGLW